MDVIGDRIMAGDPVICQDPDTAGRLAKGGKYSVKRAFSADRKQIVVLDQMPNVEWNASRFAKAPAYGWYAVP